MPIRWTWHHIKSGASLSDGLTGKEIRDVTIRDGATTNITVELRKNILGMNEVRISAVQNAETIEETVV